MRIIIFLIPNKALSGRERRIGKGKVESRRWGGEDRKGGGLCLIYVFFCYVPEKGAGKEGWMGLGQILFFFFAFVS